jgi:AMP deaminase
VGAAVQGAEINAELSTILSSFKVCLELRDKYMLRARQRLGDNPRDYDGHFPGLSDAAAGVSGAHPDVDLARSRPPAPPPFRVWEVYPRPPPPHWHWTDTAAVVSTDHRYANGDEGFDPAECEIPGPHAYVFAIDDTGVYQVYEKELDGRLFISSLEGGGALTRLDR